MWMRTVRLSMLWSCYGRSQTQSREEREIEIVATAALNLLIIMLVFFIFPLTYDKTIARTI